MERITSRQNTQFKQARKLAGSARERARAGQIFLDGTRLIEAYASRFSLRGVTLLVDEQSLSRADIHRLLLDADATRVRLLPQELFADIAQLETPEGLCALAPIPRVPAGSRDEFRILLEGIQDSGNLGALLRTAAAAGATSASLAKGCADAWSPKALRGGMGAQFNLPILEHIDALADTLKDFRGMVIATSPRAALTIFDIDLRGPVALLFGSEGRGLGEPLLALADQLVRIPISPEIESLNVAAAAAVCCFERLRQLRHARQPHPGPS